MERIKSLFEKQDDIQIGDTILIGKFKNKTALVKGFDIDDKGQPIIITDKGKIHVYKARIKKLMPINEV